MSLKNYGICHNLAYAVLGVLGKGLLLVCFFSSALHTNQALMEVRLPQFRKPVGDRMLKLVNDDGLWISEVQLTNHGSDKISTLGNILEFLTDLIMRYA